MIDRKKIVKGLECCREMYDYACQKCPYVSDCNNMLAAGIPHLASDALALIKEQEATIKAQQFVLNNACEKLKEQKIAMKPKNIDKVGGNCPVCGLRMARNYKYCYQCGQEMDWND